MAAAVVKETAFRGSRIDWSNLFLKLVRVRLTQGHRQRRLLSTAGAGVGRRGRGGLRAARRERPDFQALDAARVGVEHLELIRARTLQYLTSAGNTSRRCDYQTADRIHRLGLGERGQIETDRFGHLVQRSAGLDDENPVTGRVNRRLGLVVFV